MHNLQQRDGHAELPLDISLPTPLVHISQRSERLQKPHNESLPLASGHLEKCQHFTAGCCWGGLQQGARFLVCAECLGKSRIVPCVSCH